MRALQLRSGPAAVAALVLVLLLPQLALALVGRFGDPVAVRGEPVVVRVEVSDDPGVVAGVEVELLLPSGEVLAQRARPDRPWWAARFAADEVWDGRVEMLRARATAYGRRGGVVLELGHDEPLELQILSPERAAARARALGRTEALLDREPDELGLAGVVGAEGRLGDRARIRAVVGAEAPLDRRLTLGARVTVGPAFAAPEGLDGGAMALGLELGLRVRSGPPATGLVTTYGGPRVGADLRLPGLDGLLGVEAGLQWGLSPQVAFELGFVASARFRRLADDPGPFEVGFSGGLRAGFRLGGTEA